jgi:hypothetical protein
LGFQFRLHYGHLIFPQTSQPNDLPNIPDAHEEWGEAVALDLLLLTAPEVEVVDGSYTTVKGIAFMAYLV